MSSLSVPFQIDFDFIFVVGVLRYVFYLRYTWYYVICSFCFVRQFWLGFWLSIFLSVKFDIRGLDEEGARWDVRQRSVVPQWLIFSRLIRGVVVFFDDRIVKIREPSISRKIWVFLSFRFFYTQILWCLFNYLLLLDFFLVCWSFSDSYHISKCGDIETSREVRRTWHPSGQTDHSRVIRNQNFLLLYKIWI